MTLKELREKNEQELNQEVDKLKEELFTLRFQKATGQVQNPHRITEIRKTIARIKTVITEKAQGIR